jgi:hypothetical protein
MRRTNLNRVLKKRKYGSYSAKAIAVSIGGVAIGGLGAAGSPFEGFKLAGGDDFDSAPSRWSAVNPAGKYAHSALTIGFRRTSGATNFDNMFFVDPAFRGDRSQSPSDLGYDRVAVANGLLTLTASPPEAGLLPYLPKNFTGANGDASQRPLLISGTLKTAPHFLLSAQADFVIDTKVKFAPGVAKGYWPSFWTTTFFWPDGQEFDVSEVLKDAAGAVTSQVNLAGSTADGGANAVVQIGSGVMPSDRLVWIVGVKKGTTLAVYDDAAVQGTLALRVSYTNARIGRFRGVHDIRMDLASSNAWDNTTFNAAEWPKTVQFDYWRAWVPSAAGDNTPLSLLTAVNTSPGGSWAATLPATSTLSGGKSGREEIFGVFDNSDCPGQSTRDTATKYPGGMAVNTSTRAVTGAVPATEGGRTFLMIAYAFDDGTPAARAMLPFNVAPAVQNSLFNNVTSAYAGAVNLAVGYTDFHSGNLGPHTYVVTKMGGSWLTVNGNGTGSVSITGTAPSADEAVTLSIACTNSIGQTTTVSRTLTVSNAAWTPASWATLEAWWDANDNATVFSDAAGTAQAVAGTSVVGRINDKSGHGYALTAAANQPTYVTDAVVARKALKFTAASVQRIYSDAAGLAAVGSGNDVGYTLVMAVRRGTPGVSVTAASFARINSSIDWMRHALSSANAPGSIRYQGTTQVNAIGTSGTVASDAWYIVTWVFTGTTASFWVNGVQQGAAIPLDTAAVLFERFALGALYQQSDGTWQSPFDGEIGEVLLSSDSSKTASVASAEAYLASRFGITLG